MKPSKKYLALIALVMLAAGIVTVARYTRSDSPSVQTATTSEHEGAEAEEYLENFTHEATVKVTDAGFTPAVLYVKPDTKVFWVYSGGTKPHVIASDAGSPTPDYFGGDQPVAASAPYTAKYVAPGTYKYHDKNQPDFAGTVIVSD